MKAECDVKDGLEAQQVAEDNRVLAEHSRRGTATMASDDETDVDGM